MLELIQKVKSESGKRKFTQSVDLTISLTNIDLKKPENRFNEKVQLPYSASSNKICVIGDSVKDKAKDADLILSSKSLEKYMGDKKEAKKLAGEYDFFLAEAGVMAQFAKTLGGVFGPRGKMPEPIPPGADPSQRIKSLKKTIIVKLRENPLIQCKVGNESMNEEELKENINTIIGLVKNKLPKGESQIKSIRVKLTMGPSMKIK